MCTRRKILYLGSSIDEKFSTQVIHYPVITQVPRKKQLLPDPFSHLIFTSKNAVAIFFNLYPEYTHLSKVISIGSKTSSCLRQYGLDPSYEADPSTQEGVIALLEKILRKQDRVLYPKSSLARPLLRQYLETSGAYAYTLDLYDTLFQKPEVSFSWDEIETVMFTSSSTVTGFFQIFSEIPSHVKVMFQGPITKQTFINRRESLQ